jgi:hypothetical protein
MGMLFPWKFLKSLVFYIQKISQELLSFFVVRWVVFLLVVLLVVGDCWVFMWRRFRELLSEFSYDGD